MTRTVPHLSVELPADAAPLVRTAAELLKRRTVAGGVGCHGPGEAGPVPPDAARVRLVLAPGLPTSGFELSDAPDGALVIAGGDAHGVLYGVGKFLHSGGFTADGLVLTSWRGRSVPLRPLRGMYFATHFHNFYHDAPAADIARYVEELALWGINALAVWFDMHHFSGLDDPAAQAMVERLKIILRAARRVGMQAGLVNLANEAYASTPAELRADWTAGHDGYHHEPGGHYHVEICPSRPGGTELILRWFGEKLTAFADVRPDFIWIWPYDQGGCTCAACAPWGTNGFLHLAPRLAAAYRDQVPEGKVILSTWYFDHFTDGEWAGLAEAFRTPPPWVDYLLADDYGNRFPEFPLRHGVPGGLPLVNFPEISMYAMGPWGGYGANPLPAHLQRLWDSSRRLLSGGFPYSEGIFEDINKVICAQFYWHEAADAQAILREYAVAEFGPAVADDVVRAVAILEANHARGWGAGADGRFTLTRTEGAAEARRILEAVDIRLPAPARTAWRWRILLLRAVIDAELAAHDGRSTDACEAAFQELVRIYHAQAAEGAVRPPTRRP